MYLYFKYDTNTESFLGYSLFYGCCYGFKGFFATRTSYFTYIITILNILTLNNNADSDFQINSSFDIDICWS